MGAFSYSYAGGTGGRKPPPVLVSARGEKLGGCGFIARRKSSCCVYVQDASIKQGGAGGFPPAESA